MGIDNDTRGWILTCISGLACVLGASIVFVDHIIRLFPDQRNFKIQESNSFLSCALSLSAGVMLFSGLYKMLPHARESLVEGGYSPKVASWILLACFFGGVVGILLLSRICHHFMPTEVVDCDHTHLDEEDEEGKIDTEDHGIPHEHPNGMSTPRWEGHVIPPYRDEEERPLLARNDSIDQRAPLLYSTVESPKVTPSPTDLTNAWRKPSNATTLTRTITRFVVGGKATCDESGPCHGYSDPCGQACFKNIATRTRSQSRSPSRLTAFRRGLSAPGRAGTYETITEEESFFTPRQDMASPAGAPHSHTHTHSQPRSRRTSTNTSHLVPATPSQLHHHHVPKNAFLSLSLQTSIAITVHKLPEGFITYATNHANPTLGFNIFLALALHNITEGFALSLPLYLATLSRPRAFLYSTFLGGLSQPLGAAIAALWLNLSEKTPDSYWKPTEKVYGGMFAVTAGILAAVALSLMQEAFGLGHYKGLCTASCFVGMALLAAAGALTA